MFVWAVLDFFSTFIKKKKKEEFVSIRVVGFAATKNFLSPFSP